MWKNIIRGMASVLDIFPRVRTIEEIKEDYPFLKKTDTEALKEDWRKIGEDFKKVMGEFEEKNKHKPT